MNQESEPLCEMEKGMLSVEADKVFYIVFTLFLHTSIYCAETCHPSLTQHPGPVTVSEFVVL